MSRDWIIGLIVAAALAAFGYWVAINTEWRDETNPLPLKGEARTNPFYAAAKIVDALGATAVTPSDFDTVPPAGAVLVLSSEHWNLFPARRAALRRWVEDGGRLVLPENLVDDDDELGPWIGVRSRYHEPEKRASEKKDAAGKGETTKGETTESSNEFDDLAIDADVPPGKADTPPADADPKKPARAPAARRTPRCPTYLEKPDLERAAGVPGAGQMLPPLTQYRVCGLFDRQTLRMRDDVKQDIRPLWSLESKLGPVALRVAAGHGSVTVLTGTTPLTRRAPVRADNAKFLAAITQLKPGDTVWFVSNEDAEPLALLMWRFGWPVILLLAAAFVFAMWRGMARFGPVAAVPPSARRSLAEQIRGSAEFVLRHRRGLVLLAAEVRALDEAAARLVRGWFSMNEKQRIAALARAGGVDTRALAQARALPRTAVASDFAAAIALLESVRRRLIARGTSAPSDSQ